MREFEAKVCTGKDKERPDRAVVREFKVMVCTGKDKERPDRAVVREFKAKEKIMYVARACMGGGDGM